jgi:hypothetical protein
MTASVHDTEDIIQETSPQEQFEIKEHIAFCFTCVAKSLPLEQQLVLLLKEVYDFKLKEIAQIMDHTEAMVKYFLHTGRKKMIEIFDHRCSLINKKGICHQCTELNGIFNPKQKAQEELVKIRMVKDAASKDKEELFHLRMSTLSDLIPNGKAQTVKKAFSRETSVSTQIDSAASIVWNLLTNVSDFSRWNSTVVSLEGEIKEGGTIKLKSTLDEKRTFKLKVKGLVPEKRMVWGDGQGELVTVEQKINSHMVYRRPPANHM